MKAVLVSDFRKAPEELEAYPGSGFNRDHSSLRFLSQTSGLPLLPANSRSCGSVYVGGATRMFDEVFVGRSIRLFRSGWGNAFLHMSADLLGDEAGRITVATYADKVSRGNGMYCPSDVAELFGTEPETVYPNDSFVSLNRVRQAQGRSVLTWFVENAFAILLPEVLARGNTDAIHNARANAGVSDLWFNGEDLAVGESLRILADLSDSTATEGISLFQKDRQSPFEADFARALQGQAYYVGGIAYKQPILRFIIEQCCDHNSGLRMVDFGGGYGLLMAEMCLDLDINVELAVCRDISILNAALAARLYGDLRTELADNFRFSVGRSEDFDFGEQSFHVINFIGSLLYSPEEERLGLLERCWEQLVPGGILVVHENLKNPAYKADYDKMFTREEIDRLLGRFGPIRRFMSTTMREVDEELAGERSVFRVLTKR